MTVSCLYPAISAAWQHLLVYQGMSPSRRPLPVDDLEGFLFPVMLDQLDEILSRVPADQLETLCVGDQDEWEGILSIFSDSDRGLVERVLENLFMLTGV